MTMSPADDILVVEDDPAIVDFVQRVLRRAGYAVRTAGDGAVALAAIAEHRPALVLLDLTLPGVRGEAVVEQLRRQPSAVPIIVITASPHAAARLSDAHIRQILLKPFLLQELLDAVAASVVPPPTI